MKTLKKLVVAVTTATMIFGTVGTALAAVNIDKSAFADVDVDDEYATAFNVLAGLEIYQGNEGIGGNVRPDSTITREEFAAVVVRLIGKESTARSLNTYVPNFTDANSISSWAWGYVNVASSLGIINGYPDGSFRPQNPVTHAEVLAMLSRAVNVDKAATGVWPLNYVVLGSSVGLAKNVDIVANVPATRGEVAIMTYNAFKVDEEWDADKEKLVDREGTYGSEETENYFEAVVTEVSSSEIKFDAKPGFDEFDGAYDWAETAWIMGVNKLSDLLDLEVEVFLNDDDEVVAVVVDEEDTTTVSGALDADDLEEGKFTVDGKRYRDIDADVIVYVNDVLKEAGANVNTEAKLTDWLYNNVVPVDGDDIDDFTVDVTVSITLNDDGDVITVRVTAWDYDGYALEDYDDDEETITVDGDVIEINKNTEITINGDEATFDDLVEAFEEFVDEYDEDPLVYVATEGADSDVALKVALYTETITGDVIGNGKNGSDDVIVLEIDGDEVDVVMNDDYAGHGDAFYDGTNLPSKGRATILLDMEGKGAALLESASDVGDFYAIFVRYRTDKDGDVTSVTLKNSNGENVIYDVYDDGEPDDFGLHTAPDAYKKIVYVVLDGNDIEQVVGVEYNANDKEITNDADLVAAGADDVVNGAKIDTITSSYIKVGGDVRPFADGGVIVYDAVDDKQISLNSLKKNWTVSYALDSEGAVGLIIVTEK